MENETKLVFNIACTWCTFNLNGLMDPILKLPFGDTLR